MIVVHSKFLLAEGVLQNQDGVVHVKAKRLAALGPANVTTESQGAIKSADAR